MTTMSSRRRTGRGQRVLQTHGCQRCVLLVKFTSRPSSVIRTPMKWES